MRARLCSLSLPLQVLEDGRTTPANALTFLRACIAAGMSPEQALLAVCGIHFKLGMRSSVMPAREPDEHLVPDPYLIKVGRGLACETLCVTALGRSIDQASTHRGCFVRACTGL